MAARMLCPAPKDCKRVLIKDMEENAQYEIG